jgi:hypothetical protein
MNVTVSADATSSPACIARIALDAFSRASASAGASRPQRASKRRNRAGSHRHCPGSQRRREASVGDHIDQRTSIATPGPSLRRVTRTTFGCTPVGSSSPYSISYDGQTNGMLLRRTASRLARADDRAEIALAAPATAAATVAHWAHSAAFIRTIVRHLNAGPSHEPAGSLRNSPWRVSASWHSGRTGAVNAVCDDRKRHPVSRRASAAANVAAVRHQGCSAD